MGLFIRIFVLFNLFATIRCSRLCFPGEDFSKCGRSKTTKVPVIKTIEHLVHVDKTPKAPVHVDKTTKSPVHIDKTTKAAVQVVKTPKAAVQVDKTPKAPVQVVKTPKAPVHVDKTTKSVQMLPSKLHRKCFGSENKKIYYGECRIKKSFDEEQGCKNDRYSYARKCGRKLVCCNVKSSTSKPTTTKKPKSTKFNNVKSSASIRKSPTQKLSTTTLRPKSSLLFIKSTTPKPKTTTLRSKSSNFDNIKSSTSFIKSTTPKPSNFDNQKSSSLFIKSNTPKRTITTLRPKTSNTNRLKSPSLIIKSPSPKSTTTTPKPKSSKFVHLNDPNCGVSSVGLILGGVNAADGEFPFIVSFVQKHNDGGLENFCGGVLVSRRHVLTAAHCFYKHPLGTWLRLSRNKVVDVRVGLVDIEQRELRGAKASIKNILYHLEYEQQASDSINPINDIAIVVLNRPIETPQVGTVCLPLSETPRGPGDQSVLVGWGSNDTDTTHSVNHLQKAYAKAIPRRECQDKYDEWLGDSYHVDIGPDVLCAGDNVTDSCPGDSGAPMLWRECTSKKCRFVVGGIVSFGPSGCGSGIPGVFTKVHPYLEWIASVIQ